MSFEATVVRVSHEGSVLATFDGAVPQLGQRVKDGKGETIGRIDSVIGPISNPLTNIVILDPHLDPDTLIGTTLVFAPRGRRESRNQDRRRNSNRDKQDWICQSCNNSNFAFRTECNRCGKARTDRKDGGNRRSRDGDRGNRRFRRDDRRTRDREFRRNKSQDQSRDRDWTCKGCGNNNFSFRTECNRCGKAKNGGNSGPKRERSDSRRSENRTQRRLGKNGERRQNSGGRFNRTNNRGNARGSRGSNNFRDRNRR
ncbi:MAG: zinc finger protein [Candidatus Thermoplasmatota archaeon]|nr:zinc finger protein [Candidatus Thermoplasmatota archaeon]